MTEKDLQSIKFLKIEIARSETLLKGLNCTGQSSNAYAELLTKTKDDLLRKKTEIESIIHGIEDAEIRLILKLKFVDLKSWNYIARTMHYDRSTVYKKYKKFIKGDGQ